ncbi:MAG: SusC/RagA family TonB-linked outer membrane protein [Ferruginibacter sp.]
MRRFLTLFTVLMLSAVLAFAQNRVVTGKVTDANGKPVPFASVVVKGGGGVQADANGEYSIKVAPNDVLVISGTGLQQVEVPVGSMTYIDTRLQLRENTLQEVVVTGAFGIKRAARSTTTNVQNVTGDQLNTVRQSNVNNALAGKVAGAQIRSQSAAALGRETNVRLRGENGLGTGAGPIYVIDGTIMPSANDINPDDIEDLNVLQGPASAALFGSDGSNGAIVITTKKARKGQKGIGLEVNTGMVFDRIYITPNYQNSYAGGSFGDLVKYKWTPGQPEAWKALDGKYYHDYSDDASWGPRMVGQEYIPWYAWYGGHDASYKTAKLTPQPNNIKDFYNTGITATNNINFSKAGDGYNFRGSYTNLDVKGLIPNSYLKRNTFNANFSIDLGTKLTFASNINFIHQRRNAENNDAYSNQSTGSFSQWFHRDLDLAKMKELRGLRTPEGIYASWNKTNPDGYNPDDMRKSMGGNYWYNFFTYFDLVSNLDTRERIFGDASLTYKFNNDFRIKGTYRKQQLTTDASSIYPQELERSGYQASFNPWEGNGVAGYGVSNSYSNRQNFELLASYNKKFGEFNVDANAGIDIFKATLRGSNQNTNGGINVDGLYSLTNSKSPITYGQAYSEFKRRSPFVRAGVGYKNMVFVDATFRKDYTSAEPVGNVINTKSFGGSFVFSELIKDKSILSYGKIRASWGQLLNSLPAYALNYAYAPAADLFNGNFLMGEPNTLISPTLQGATNDEKEIGIETRFLKNRLGVTATFWDRTNKDFPVVYNIDPTSGYSFQNANAGEVAKRGVELQVFANPFKFNNFDWNIVANWGYITRNEVVSIAPGVNRLNIATGAFSGTSAAYTVNQVGKPWGQMFGGGIKRNEAGKPILNADGTFIKQDTVQFGSVLPRYTGGFQNTITLFKNFTVNINIDYQNGGKFFSLSDHWGTFSGLTARTAVLNDKGNSVRDAVADGGGVHVFGVDQDGKDVDYYVEAQDYFHQFRNKNISEVFIHDLSFVKLREVSVGYKLPVERMGAISKYVKNATFSVIARNPWLIWSQTKDFDPSEISNVYGEDGQMPGTRSVGFNLRIGF